MLIWIAGAQYHITEALDMTIAAFNILVPCIRVYGWLPLAKCLLWPLIMHPPASRLYHAAQIV